MRVCSLCQRCTDDSIVYCVEEGHPPLSEMRDGDPEMIEGYRLEFLLGSGTSYETYRASHSASGQSCLIRIYPSNGVNANEFLRESKLASTLFHPNVVDIYEAGSLADGSRFVVAEDPDGRTLRYELRTRGVPELLTTIEIVRQTAEALHAMHTSGLTHRSIRPENIVLTLDEQSRLLVRIQNPDFGGVAERSIISNKFLIDSALDSLRYFAPEQCAGSGSSARTDVYSLGIVLYEMLAGAPPFDAPKAKGLIEKHRTQHPPDVRIDNFDLRMLVTHTLMETLQKHPATRQSSAGLVARQLRHIEQLATHVSTPPPAGVVPAPPPRSSARLNITTGQENLPAEIMRAPVLMEVDVRPRDPEPIAEVEIVDRSPEPVAEVEILHRDPEPVAKSAAQLDLDSLPAAEISDNVPDPAPEKPAVWNVLKEKLVTVHARANRLKLRHKRLRAEIVQSIVPEFDPGTEDKSVDIQPMEIRATRADHPEITPAVAIERTKVEWVQPEDDIPSLADVMDVLANDQQTDAPVIAAPVMEIASPTADIGTAYIELAVREEIPVVADEPEVSLAKPSQETAPIVPAPVEIDVIPAKEEAIVAAAAAKAEPIIENAEPALDLTPVVEVPRARAKAAAMSATVVKDKPAKKELIPEKVRQAFVRSEHSEDRISWVKGVLKTRPDEQPVRIPVVRDELEEITVVRARRNPIRIDLNQTTYFAPYKKFSASIPDETGFFPTLLGEVQKREPIELDATETILASYSDRPVSSSRITRRAIAIGAISVGLIFAFLFVDDLGTYLQTSGSSDSVAAKTTSTQAALPVTNPAESVSPVKKKAPKPADKLAADENQFKTFAIKQPGTTRESDPKRAADNKSSANLRKSSTTATPSVNEKPRSKAVVEKRPAGKRSSPIQDKPSPAGRPRIVANPKQ